MSSGPKGTVATMIACLNFRGDDAAVDWFYRAFGFQWRAVDLVSEGYGGRDYAARVWSFSTYDPYSHKPTSS